MGAPDSPVRHRTGTVPCPVHRHVTQLLGFRTDSTIGALSSCGTGQSGATLTSCSDFCHDTIHLLELTLRVDSRCSAGSPDSPVAHRTVR
jgi:hypothetical protein